MKKNVVMKCVNSKNNNYLTDGKCYPISAGDGDVGSYGLIGNGGGFEIIDDHGDSIFQGELDGLHGLFEVKNV